MTCAALLVVLSATPQSVSLDGDSACAPRAVLARELQRTSLAFVDSGGDLRVTLTPRDGAFSLVVRRGGAVALERHLKDGTCDDAGLATALILERYVREVSTPLLAEAVDAGVPAPVVAAPRVEKPKLVGEKKKPQRGGKGTLGDATAWVEPYREPPSAPPLPGDEGGRAKSGAAVSAGATTAASTGSPGATTGRTTSAGGGRPDDGNPTGGTTGRISSAAGGKTGEPAPGAAAGGSPSTGSGKAAEGALPGTALTGIASTSGTTAAAAAPPGARPGETASGQAAGGSPSSAEQTTPSSAATTATAASAGASTTGSASLATGKTGERTPPGATPAASGKTSDSTPGGESSPTGALAAATASAATTGGVRVEKAEVTHGEVASTLPRRNPVRLTRWEVLAGAGTWMPTPATLSVALSLDAALVLDEHWRVALGGTFSFGGSVPVTDEAGATRGSLTARALLLAPAASWCTTTRVRACGGILAGVRLGIGSTSGDYIFQSATRWAPTPSFGPTAQLSTSVARFAAAFDLSLLVNPVPSSFTVEGLSGRIDTPVVEFLARLSVGYGVDR